MATQYRKKPVCIEAMHLSADTTEDPSTGAQVCDLSLAGIVGWASAHGVRLSVIGMRRPFGLSIPSLEGRMEASPGDYIIRGVRGEFYPCKPDIFEATYEPAEEQA